MVTARILGREEFGKYGILQSTVGMLGVFAGLGLGLTATKYVAEYRTRDPKRAGAIIALGSASATVSGLLLTGALMIFAPTLAAKGLNSPQLTTELRIASIVLFLNALNGAQTGVLAGFESFRAIARINTAKGLLALPITVVAVLLWKLPGALLALAFLSAQACVLSEISIRRHCARLGIQVKASEAWKEARILWSFSAPALLAGALVGPITWIGNTMLVRQTGGYGEMGIFSAANQWRAAVAFLPSLLSQPLLAMLSHAGTADSSSFRKLLRANLILAVGLSASVALPIGIFASWIMRAYGAQFFQGKPVLIVLAVTTVFSSLAAVIGQAIASLDRMWSGFFLNAIWAVAFLLLAAILTPRYRALGLAGAYLGSYIAHTAAELLYLRISISGTLDQKEQPSHRQQGPDELPR
jgi:O-antigen/teichoic acid export membrane protein